MERYARLAPVMAVVLALATSGCGGGGGAGGTSADPTSTVTPAPGPKPTPTPSPPPATAVFGALGQTTSQTFAVLSYGYHAADNGFGYNIDPKSFDPNVGVGLRLSAPSSLLFSLTGGGEATMVTNGASGISPTFGTVSLGYNTLGGSATISSAYNSGVTDTLKSTAFGFWIKPSSGDPSFPNQGVDFVYGVPTAQSGLPQSGTAVYAFQGAPPGLRVQTVTVDFGARSVTGDAVIGDPGATVTYRLTNGVIANDGTVRAILRADSVPQDGMLEGRFTGPIGQELMVRLMTLDAKGQTSYAVGAGGRN